MFYFGDAEYVKVDGFDNPVFLILHCETSIKDSTEILRCFGQGDFIPIDGDGRYCDVFDPT